MTQSNELVIGLAGYGIVGTGLAKDLYEGRDLIARRTGKKIRIKTILVRHLDLPRAWPVPADARLTTDAAQLTGDPEIDVVVELIGGTGAAHDIIHAALAAGKHVVTANKALLAENSQALFKLAAEKNLHLGYEASVAGAIPAIHTLKDGLAGNKIQSLMGILNGTSNYILTEMTRKGIAFSVALKDAQDLGFAEADPTLDIDGHDAAHKLVILARLAWGVNYPYTEMPVVGIRKVDPIDINFARELGYTVKLLAQARMCNGQLEAGVFPTLVHESFLLANVGGAYNAVRIKGNAAGSIFLHGKGAGGAPTGSAVLSDLLDIARGATPNNTGFLEQVPPRATVLSPEEAQCPYYFRLQVPDHPGVLRDVAGAMADNAISIANAIQKGHSSDEVPLVFMTHTAKAASVARAIKQLANGNLLRSEAVCYRVLSPE